MTPEKLKKKRLMEDMVDACSRLLPKEIGDHVLEALGDLQDLQDSYKDNLILIENLEEEASKHRKMKDSLEKKEKELDKREEKITSKEASFIKTEAEQELAIEKVKRESAEKEVKSMEHFVRNLLVRTHVSVGGYREDDNLPS